MSVHCACMAAIRMLFPRSTFALGSDVICDDVHEDDVLCSHDVTMFVYLEVLGRALQ
uniref:Uncharacterized protein n=1 Tax=Ciona intestinalis TaxID=7719 RepID=H2XUC7_CIOIN